ncbi:MAG: hypothetical protein ACLFTE_07865 [Salinivenus sp.]
MVTLYRRLDDPWADEIQDALDEMVIAYTTETVEHAAAQPDDVPQLPALRVDDEVVADPDALRDQLDRLRSLMDDWDRFQSDACYLEDDGTIC